MKASIKNVAATFALAAMGIFTSCTKADNTPEPTKPGGGNPGTAKMDTVKYSAGYLDGGFAGDKQCKEWVSFMNEKTGGEIVYSGQNGDNYIVTYIGSGPLLSSSATPISLQDETNTFAANANAIFQAENTTTHDKTIYVPGTNAKIGSSHKQGGKMTAPAAIQDVNDKAQGIVQLPRRLVM